MQNFFQFKKRMINMYGCKGELWIESLPSLVEKYAKEWNLSDLQTVADLSMNYILRGLHNHEKIILKIGFEKDGITREAAALQAFSGHGCVRLIAQDPSDGVLLLQCANPGNSLKSMFPDQDREATRITAAVIQKLHNSPLPEKNIFPNLGDWLSVLDKEWHLPAHHLTQARKLRDYLMTSTTHNVLLHGDLHHSNILADGDDWLAIDPKGVIGDQTYEVNCFICNPLLELSVHKGAKDIILKRLHEFSHVLNFNMQRMLCWCYVQSVVAACWEIENNSCPDIHIKLADIFEGINRDCSF